MLHEQMMIETEVGSMLTVASDVVNNARKLIADGISSPGNIRRPLQKTVDDYLESLDAQIEKKDAAFLVNRVFLERIRDSGDPQLDDRVAKLKAQCDQISE
mmetsp:Transcript_20937/g.25737  ORF Transcript_20937/g.25737 Transcript_20937/m.25737 type:complete len:101 (-) Transcript_20937:503-805(-)